MSTDNEQMDELDRQNISRFIQHFLGSHNSASQEDVIRCGCVATLIEGSREQAKLAIVQHTKEAVEAAQIHEVQEVRRWIRASGMAPDFEKRLTAVAGYLDRRLTELFSGQSKGGGDTQQKDGDA